MNAITRYSRLEEDEEKWVEMQDADEEQEETLLHDRRSVRRRAVQRSHELLHWIAHTLLLALCIFLLPRSLSQPNRADRSGIDDYEPMWSPAMPAVEGTGHFVRFDGSFATPNEYKGKPSLEIDKSWDRVTFAQGGVISITEEVLTAVNASKEYSVKLDDSIGGGYMASVEVLHQLHCLNMLRQATYEGYYKDKAGPWRDTPEILRHHLDHCIDNLRQKLMCDADTGILTYVWVKGHPKPFPDFNVQHKCRNFDSILDWVGKRQVYVTSDDDVTRLAGSKELESAP